MDITIEAVTVWTIVFVGSFFILTFLEKWIKKILSDNKKHSERKG